MLGIYEQNPLLKIGVGDVFATRAKNARLAQIFPWVFLEVFICGESSPKIQMYNEQKAISALTREKSKCLKKKCRKP